MIQTRNEIRINAPPEPIFALAAATELWPKYLPHYRTVRLIEEDAQSRTLEMSAWRDFIPVRWIARQWNDAQAPAIRFQHIAGWTRGMDVEWRFVRENGATRVSIVHDLDFRFPFARDFLGKHVVSDFFVHDIANKTLLRMKELAEHA